jgi:hypothetical protein
MSFTGVTASPVKSSVQVGETSVHSNTIAIPVYVQEASPVSEAIDHSGPAFPPGLPTDRLWPSRDDAYWRHLREMWDANSNGADSRRPSATSPGSPALSDDANVVDLEDVDLRSATAQQAFRLNNLPTLIKAQTDAANKPLTLDLHSAHALPLPRSFAGRRTFNGVIVTTQSTTRAGFHDPAPPYTPRAAHYERSFGVDGYAVEQKEVSQINKWTYWIPSCKWLFWIGFVFPLLWALGGTTLLLGMHQSPASAMENGTSKLSQFINQAQIDEKHRVQNEKIWAKRCAWAFGFAFFLIPTIVALVIMAPYINAPAAVPTFTAGA